MFILNIVWRVRSFDI